MSCASGRCGTSSPRSCSRSACRCCSAETSSHAPSAATTTPTARTTSSPGSPGSTTSASSACSPSRGGSSTSGAGAPDAWWFRPDGRKMTQRNWQRRDTRTLGVFLNGAEIPALAANGAPVVDDTFLILFNASDEAVVFTLPAVSFGRRWVHEVSTAEPELEPGSEVHPARGVVAVEGRSLVV